MKQIIKMIAMVMLCLSVILLPYPGMEAKAAVTWNDTYTIMYAREGVNTHVYPTPSGSNGGAKKNYSTITMPNGETVDWIVSEGDAVIVSGISDNSSYYRITCSWDSSQVGYLLKYYLSDTMPDNAYTSFYDVSIPAYVTAPTSVYTSVLKYNYRTKTALKGTSATLQTGDIVLVTGISADQEYYRTLYKKGNDTCYEDPDSDPALSYHIVRIEYGGMTAYMEDCMLSYESPFGNTLSTDSFTVTKSPMLLYTAYENAKRYTAPDESTSFDTFYGYWQTEQRSQVQVIGLTSNGWFAVKVHDVDRDYICYMRGDSLVAG